MKRMLTVFLLLLAAAVPAALADAKEDAMSAAAKRLPNAQIDYALMERDDGRDEWLVFYSENGTLGVCKVLDGTAEVCRIESYEKVPEGALTAGQAVEKLIAQKGEMTIVELDYDWSNSLQALRYDGEAEQGGKRYEFMMNVDGEIVKWERD